MLALLAPLKDANFVNVVSPPLKKLLEISIFISYACYFSQQKNAFLFIFIIQCIYTLNFKIGQPPSSVGVKA